MATKKKPDITSLQQKYISAPKGSTLQKFYRDMLIKLGAKIPKL